MRSQKRLGEILRDKGLIDDPQLAEALRQQRKTNDFIGTIMVHNGFISQEVLLAVLSEQFDLPVVELSDRYIDWKVVTRFSPSLILDRRCFPVRQDVWSVTFAITNPLDAWAIHRAEEEARPMKVKLVLVSEKDMQAVLNRYKQYVRGKILKQ